MKRFNLILLFFCGSLLAKEQKLAVRETHQDLIRKAQNLSLQKDRLQATKILQRGIFKEKGQARKDLIQALKELSEVFYTDKGQQLFELGESIKVTSPQTALERYNEAIQVEPDNVFILKAISRSQLGLKQCEKAKEVVEAAYQLNSFDEEILLLKAQAEYCAGKEPVSKIYQDLQEIKKPMFKIFADSLKARVLEKESKLVAAEALVEKTLTLDSRFPEAHFINASIKQKIGKEAQESLSKYVSLCSELSIEKKRKYIFEPWLCQEVRKAEAEIEKIKQTKMDIAP